MSLAKSVDEKTPPPRNPVINHRTPNLAAKKMKWKRDVPLYVELQQKYQESEKQTVKLEAQRRRKVIDSQSIKDHQKRYDMMLRQRASKANGDLFRYDDKAVKQANYLNNFIINGDHDPKESHMVSRPRKRVVTQFDKRRVELQERAVTQFDKHRVELQEKAGRR